MAFIFEERWIGFRFEKKCIIWLLSKNHEKVEIIPFEKLESHLCYSNTGVWIKWKDFLKIDEFDFWLVL